MNTFKNFVDINEELEVATKKELVCRNVLRLVGANINDKYIRKIARKGQKEDSRLVVYMNNGDVFDLIPASRQNLQSN